MEPKTSIRQHDFISGEPIDKWIIHFDIETTNPCGEIQLQDWQETILSEGIQQGELNVIMSPPGVGKTGILQRMVAEMEEERRVSRLNRVSNFDYASMYPHIQQQNITQDQRDFVDKLTLNSFY